MSRAWRIEYEGALYHVLARGNDQKSIFIDDEDRHLFAALIGEMSERFKTDIYAYTLMDNHYHLILKTHNANLSRCMQWLGATYTRRFNIRHKKNGHLFQGRFKSFLMEDDDYLMRLSCYIHRNPLRAGMVDRLADYKWSSYHAYAYGKNQETWLKTRPILSQFSGTRKELRLAYKKKVQTYSQEEKGIWEDFRHGLFLGSQSFVNLMKTTYFPEKPSKEKPQQQHMQRSIDPAEFLNRAAGMFGCDLDEFKQAKRVEGADKTHRDLLVYLLWETGRYTNTQIGKQFNLGYSSISKIVSEIRPIIINDKKLKEHFAHIKSRIQK